MQLAQVKAVFSQGRVPLALGPDAAGFPKRPLAARWTSIPYNWKLVQEQPWEQATGLGIQLGLRSGNLGAIDIDDADMADAAFAWLVRSHIYPEMVWTIRNRLHVYVRETTPSRSVAFKVQWEGRQCQVELKATGTQVAAPPTPGYTLACDRPPWSAPALAAAWGELAMALGVKAPEHTTGSAGYPQPWQPHVEAGERNKALYIEAHKLREAGLGLEAALEIMRVRYESHYEQAESEWQEAERTIRSAFRRREIGNDGPGARRRLANRDQASGWEGIFSVRGDGTTEAPHPRGRVDDVGGGPRQRL